MLNVRGHMLPKKEAFSCWLNHGIKKGEIKNEKR